MLKVVQEENESNKHAAAAVVGRCSTSWCVTARSACGEALREVFPDTTEQRCWFHVQGNNVLAALPKSAHPGCAAQ